jgi:tripartite-type tricarboxylate transporter receptor subunit TctC
MRRATERFVLFLLVFCAAAASAQDNYPSRAVHLVVPYTPGTGADILARLLGPKLSERWKVAVVVENRVGATGNIGADFVAKSAPDGYTLLVAATSFGTNPALARSLPFDPVKSFAPVGLIATSALAVIVNAQVPARDMRELIELARREPGKLHYGSPGSGGVQHLAMELLKLETGIDVVHVPYKGLGGAMADVIAGHVQAVISALQSAAPHVHSGKLRMLAVMSAERAAAFPEVPTLKESGLGDLEVETWYAAFAPAGTQPGVIARFNSEMNLLLKDPAIRDLLEKQGMTAVGGPPAKMASLLDRELARWSRVVSASGIKAD